jgi:N-acetylneuraminic acid mutarotase
VGNRSRLLLRPPVAIPVLTLSLLLAGSGCNAASSKPASSKPASSKPAANRAPGRIWSNVNPTGSIPLPRDGHWMSDDSTNGKVILFGGKGNGSHYFNDTWAYTPATNAWTKLRPAGVLPPGRFGHSLVYDPAGRKTILFGGVTATTNQPANDLWAYSSEANTWTRLNPAGGSPPARTYPSMVYDPVTGQAILFGGWTGSSTFDDTWAYEPSTSKWHKLSTTGRPHARWGSSMVYDSASGKLILFGGLFGSYDGSNRLNDTWEFDPATNAWKNLAPTGDLPPARGYASMVYDSATGKVILFGGFGGSDGLLADTWAYNPRTNTWDQLHPGRTNPSRRDFSSAIYDQRTDTAILFGGLSGGNGNVNGTVLNDTWRR